MQLLSSERVPEYCRKPVLVLGCGNPLFGDDGLGPAVIEELERRLPARLEDEVCLLDVGISARTVLFTIALSEIRPRRIIVVDAVDVKRAPGEVFAVPIDELPARKIDDFSMHQLPTSNLLRELRDGRGIDVEIVSCQVAVLPEAVAPGLSKAVQRAVPEVCDLVIRRLDDELTDAAGAER